MSEQKTVIIFDQCGELPIQFFVVEGDFRVVDRIYLNTDNDAPEAEATLNELMEKELTRDKALDEFPTTAVLEGAFVVVCGFVP